MIQPNSPEESAPVHMTEIPFAGVANLGAPQGPKYRPFGHIMRLDWEPQTMVGGLHLPQKMKTLPFYRVRVLDVGPDVKMVKAGDWVIMPSQVILTAKWDDESGRPHTAYFSSEDKILAVVG